MPPRILLLAALLAGCAGAAPSRPAPPPERNGEACVLQGAAGDSVVRGVVVAAAGAADTALLSPVRARTPIGLDCTGRPVPRLATSWSSDSGGRSWTLVVPSSAALASAWRRRSDATQSLRLAGVASFLPLDERRLVVSLDAPSSTIPALFADPTLADTGAEPALRPLPPAPDLRDAVDRHADLIITADPAVADYAERRGGYAARPLPWSRTYVLVLPADGESLGVVDSPGFRDALARDAVRTWARGAAGARWWETASCNRPAPTAARPGPAVVIYPSGDSVARALAERFVATAAGAGVARGVTDGGLGAAVTGGLGTAFVVPLPVLPLVPCREIASWPAGARAVPLVDTRRMALVRDGTRPLRVDYDGGVLPTEGP